MAKGGPGTAPSTVRVDGAAEVPALRAREAELHLAATRLFRELGFHATSMQDLAEAMGMNRGSLYHYIDSKDDLLWTIVSGALAHLDALVGPSLDSGEPGATRLRNAICQHLRFAATHGDELALVQIEMHSLAPERRRELVARRDAYEGRWRAAIDSAIADGTFRPVDVRIAGIAILSACNWFTQWYRASGSLTADDVAREFADLYLGGLMAPPSTAGGPRA